MKFPHLGVFLAVELDTKAMVTGLGLDAQAQVEAERIKTQKYIVCIDTVCANVCLIQTTCSLSVLSVAWRASDRR